MDFRGMPLGGGSGLELLVLLVPLVFVVLLARRMLTGKKFTAGDVFGASWIILLMIGGLVMLAVVVAVPAIVASSIVMLAAGWAIGMTMQDVSTHVGIPLFALAYAGFAFLVYRFFTPDKRERMVGADRNGE